MYTFYTVYKRIYIFASLSFVLIVTTRNKERLERDTIAIADMDGAGNSETWSSTVFIFKKKYDVYYHIQPPN